MASAIRFDLAQCFRMPLLDLGKVVDRRLAGILIPEPDVGQKRVGITAQFLKNAEIYHDRYTNLPYHRAILERAFHTIGGVPQDATVLDLGSGSGNTIFPCLELLRNCRIVATDLSPDLLRILLATATEREIPPDRLALVCTDATRDVFKPGSFDVVVGAAILHHLIDPRLAICAAAKALTPGGSAIFFEPFEAGHAILQIAYAEILRHRRVKTIHRRVRKLLKCLISDCQIRSGRDKSAEIYRCIDDKWLFTRTYIDECATAAGVSHVIISPLSDIEAPLTIQATTHLRLGLGYDPEALPPWAWDILRGFDRMFSDDLKHDLPIEACIILRK